MSIDPIDAKYVAAAREHKAKVLEERVRRWHASGLTITMIAQQMGTTRTTVRKTLQRLGLEPNDRKEAP